MLRADSMATPSLTFVADDVETDTTEYTPECVVHLIAFGNGDPEADGHCLTFSRCFDEDWGVCTVRGIQHATFCEGIESFKLKRSGCQCVFAPKAAEKAGFRKLRISFRVDDDSWKELTETAKIVFRGCPYFTVAE